MKSILEGRPALTREVEQVAEVAGYLWQKGWAERNGGNITVNVTEFVDDEILQMPAIAEPVALGVVLENLKLPVSDTMAVYSRRATSALGESLPSSRHIWYRSNKISPAADAAGSTKAGQNTSPVP